MALYGPSGSGQFIRLMLSGISRFFRLFGG